MVDPVAKNFNIVSRDCNRFSVKFEIHFCFSVFQLVLSQALKNPGTKIFFYLSDIYVRIQEEICQALKTKH